MKNNIVKNAIFFMSYKLTKGLSKQTKSYYGAEIKTLASLRYQNSKLTPKITDFPKIVILKSSTELE